eukprot:TRINITY_DN7382_c2_g1_i1.p2 TRINITY_DN7382_c2_g1~~TRINITY_DN7382_c2_g1_i1.p2  ORF type:complete len:131 (-),score=32.28 TRINITY_DN7382_c2_g1_i1:197-589(-)
MAAFAGSTARFARCRSGHLSYFLKRSNAAAFQVHRGLSTSALSAVCTELRPPAGFPEQRISALVADASSAAAEGEGGGVSAAASATDAVAALIDAALERMGGLGSESLSCMCFNNDMGGHKQCDISLMGL